MKIGCHQFRTLSLVSTSHEHIVQIRVKDFILGNYYIGKSNIPRTTSQLHIWRASVTIVIRAIYRWLHVIWLHVLVNLSENILLVAVLIVANIWAIVFSLGRLLQTWEIYIWNLNFKPSPLFNCAIMVDTERSIWMFIDIISSREGASFRLVALTSSPLYHIIGLLLACYL